MGDKHVPRRRFGQNFLQDKNIINKIIRAIHPKNTEHFVEIGPGMGALTENLISLVKQLDVVEIDRDLVAVLQAKWPSQENFFVHEADALKFDFCRLAQANESLRVVGNLPYNISTPLLFHLLSQVNCIADMFFMLQEEVVNRIVSEPGHKSYGRLSVMVQYFCQADYIFDVPPTAFYPKPQVNSAIVRLKPKQPDVPVNDFKMFSDIVREAFNHRRKQLANSLKAYVSAAQLEQIGIDAHRRPEDLSVVDFVRISNLIV